MSLESSEGCAANSKPSSVRTNGNLAIELAICMHRHFLAGVENAHLLVHQHRDRFADQSPRYAVAIGFQLDARIGMHATDAFAQRLERGASFQRPQRGGFLRAKALQRNLARGAM